MNEKEKQIEDAYKMVKGKANSFSNDELEKIIISGGYDKNIAKEALKKISADRQKILSEISNSLKDKSKNELKAPKKKKNIFIPIGTFFKKIYFFFEDKYYSMVDSINKVIPISKLVDGIDKVLPSFLLFLIFIIGLIWLIFFSGILGGIPSLEVTVTDSLNMQISGATVILSINDENTTLQTDAFGTVVFEDIKYKKNQTKLIVEKEAYNTKVEDLKLKGGNNSILVKLGIDTTTQLHLSEERIRNITFKENETLLATRPLQVTVRCSNSGKIPEPSSATVTSGQLPVKQVMGCGDLRIDVSSNFYDSLQNVLVPEENTIMLTLKTNNYGTLEVTVKDQNTQQPISGTLLQLYRPDDTTTQVNESNIAVISGTTTVYGKFVFTNLTPGSYTILAGKDGYISPDRFGPYQVVVNNNTQANLNLAAGQKTLTVILVDANGNTTREIKGDIDLYRKVADSNIVTKISSKEDVNSAVFGLASEAAVTYKISVTDTERYGYYAPDIVDVNNIDTNRTIEIPLEYSSALNSGKIGVNVKRNGYNIGASEVYLFREEEDDIPVAGPILTNDNGDCNFINIRARRDYYAYARSNIYQGVSIAEELDANDFLELNINLQNQAKILNLKVTPRIDYNIAFYDSTDDVVTNYTVSSVSGADTNKEYIFRTNTNEVYAVISAQGKSTYQTDLITLINGQKTYYALELEPINNSAISEIESLGLYDETGTLRITSINLAEDISKTYKLKFKLKTTNKINREYAYAYIVSGKRVTLPSDYLRLQNAFAPNSQKEYGCNFSGTTIDWNENHFTANYNLDHSQANCSSSTAGFKWTKIDFSNSQAGTIEFSVNFKFQNGITNPADYVIYYKSLTKANGNYVLNPTLNSSWQQCNIRPNGFFYSPQKIYSLPFSNNDYAFTARIYDYNLENNTAGNQISPTGSTYSLDVSKNYYYSQKLIYFKTTQSTGDINAFSKNTLYSLKYKKYNFKSINNLVNPPQNTDLNANINSTNYLLENQNIRYGTDIDNNSQVLVTDFFSNGASISTKIINISGLNPYDLPVLSYYSDSNTFIEIITNDVSENNDVYYGDNNISFRVRSNTGEPIPGIEVSCKFLNSDEVSLGETDSNGVLLNKTISLPQTLIGYNVDFIFTFPVNYGLENNQIVRSKLIKSGYGVFLENGTAITLHNPLQYFVGKYYKNDIPTITKDEKEYYIKRISNNAGRLTNIDVYGNSAAYIDYIDVNYFIYSQNPTIPRYLEDLNHQIKTRMALINIPQKNNITGNIPSVLGGYKNIINVGQIEGQQIVLEINAPFKANIAFDINTDIEIEGIPRPGIKKQAPDSPITIELIKNLSSTVDFNYIVTNNSDKNMSVTVDANNDSALQGYLTIQHNAANIPENKISKIQLVFDLNNSQSIPNTITSPVTINFNFTVNGVTFTEKINTLVSIFDQNKTHTIGQLTNYTMDCSSSNCSSNLVIPITNHTKTYDLVLTNLSFIDSDNNLTIGSLQDILPFDINSSWTQQTKNLNLTILGNYNSLKQTTTSNDYAAFIIKNISKNLKYDFNIAEINNSGFNDTKITMFNIRVWLQTIQEILEENGLYGNICLGVGGINVDWPSNFYILGSCEDESFNDCKSGEDAKPKILYDWSNQPNWATTCIENIEADYNQNKTHCDSAQMLFSVFSLINTSASAGQIGDNKYIYLMSDGVSKDLLSDYINNTEFMGVANTSNWDNNVLTDYNINNGNFSIEKTEIDNAGQEVNTQKPGKYQIILNPDFTINQNYPLHIKLRLVREMPYNMRNLLYYMPIDGKLGVINTTAGKRSARDGYGTSIINDSNLPISILENDEIYLYKTADGNSSRTIINLENNESNLSKGLRSGGKLLDMTLTAIDPADDTFNVTVVYSPTLPIPIYAKVVNSNQLGLSYKVKRNTMTVPIDFSNFLIWTDYNNERKILADGQYIDGVGNYQKSMIEEKKFISAYGTNNNNKLLKTMMYWPMLKYGNDYGNLKLILKEGIDNLGNHANSKIYTLSNIDNNGSIESGAFSNLSNINPNNQIDLSDLFETYVMDGNACIKSGLTVTTIRWVDEKINLTQEEINKILEDFDSDNQEAQHQIPNQ